jgi:hypothetical protein
MNIDEKIAELERRIAQLEQPREVHHYHHQVPVYVQSPRYCPVIYPTTSPQWTITCGADSNFVGQNS